MRKLLLLVVFFSLPALAQFLPQNQPTQPDVIVVHPKPAPNFDSCERASVNCVYSGDLSQPADLILNQYCGYPNEAFKFISNASAGFPCGEPEEGVEPDKAIECLSCTCPEGQIREDSICVPDQSCPYGIQDYVTGACFPPTCPYGDGTPENCHLVPSCVSYENSILIPANGVTPASCQCPAFTDWNAEQGMCVTPVCGVTEGPANSFYNGATHACECSITAALDVPTNSCVENSCSSPTQVWNPVLHSCVAGKSCPKNYDLNTSTGVCYKVTSESHRCDLQAPWEAYITVFTNLDDPDDIAELKQFRADKVAACEAEKLNPTGNYLTLWKPVPTSYFNELWDTPIQFCERRGGIWNSNYNTCMNGALQDELPPSSSSSSSSSKSSSSKSSLSVSSSSVDSSSLSSSSLSSSATGGGGGSSGTGTSSGSGGEGGEGGNGGDGSGGNGGASSLPNIQSSVASSEINSSSGNNNSSVANNNSSASGSTGNGHASSVASGSATSTSGSVDGNASSRAAGSTGSAGGGGGCNINCNGNGSAGSSGSVGSSGSQGSTSSKGAGECDPESKDYLDCIGKNKKPFAAHTTTESGATTIGEVNTNFLNSVSNSPLIGSFNGVKNIVVASDSSCPEFSIDLSDTVIATVLSTSVHCDLMDLIKPILSIITMIMWSFLAFRIFASA